MRQTLLRQLPLVPSIDHGRGRELAAMSAALDELPERVLRAVEVDLRQGARSDRGRRGMAAEQVVRAMVVKQLAAMSYDRLAFTLSDSVSYRAFCRLSPGHKAPSKSTLQSNIKRLTPQTLQQVHCAIVELGLRRGVDDGQRVGVDSTTIESNIHHPTDSALLWDCVNKLTSLLQSGTQFASVQFSDHRKRAKRRTLQIAMAKSMKARVPLYKDLLRVVGYCLKYAQNAVSVLLQHDGAARVQAQQLAATLQHFIALVKKVCSQAFRRVVLGEQLAPSDKIVSLFEPHTDIIIKDRRDTTYGHKMFLTVGRSGLVFDLRVPRGNPSDITLAEPMIDALHDKYALTPLEAAFDGGFCSHANLHAIKEAGVQAVAFTSPRGLRVEQMTGSRARFESLRRFRASIEGAIGWLKTVFGLRRCTWRGFDSFQSYCWASVLSLNLLVIARHGST